MLQQSLSKDTQRSLGAQIRSGPGPEEPEKSDFLAPLATTTTYKITTTYKMESKKSKKGRGRLERKKTTRSKDVCAMKM